MEALRCIIMRPCSVLPRVEALRCIMMQPCNILSRVSFVWVLSKM